MSTRGDRIHRRMGIPGPSGRTCMLEFRNGEGAVLSWAAQPRSDCEGPGESGLPGHSEYSKIVCCTDVNFFITNNFSCCCLDAKSCPTLRPRGLTPTRLLCPWDSPGRNSGVDCHFLLQGIFPNYQRY